MDIAALYVEWMNMPLDALGMSHEMAHIHAGLAIYVVMQMLLRTRRASGIALQAVIGAEIVNEILQRAHYGSWRRSDTLMDVALTALWPTALYLTAKFRRARWHIGTHRRQDGSRVLTQQQARAMELARLP